MLRRHLLPMIGTLGLFLSSISGATESVSPPMVALPSTIHFTAPDGSDMSVVACTYRIEQIAERRLRLVTDA